MRTVFLAGILLALVAASPPGKALDPVHVCVTANAPPDVPGGDAATLDQELAPVATHAVAVAPTVIEAHAPAALQPPAEVGGDPGCDTVAVTGLALSTAEPRGPVVELRGPVARIDRYASTHRVDTLPGVVPVIQYSSRG